MRLNRRALAGVPAVAVIATLPLAVTASSADAACTTPVCAVEGQILDVRLGDLHATQPSLGKDEVYYRLGRYTLGKDEPNKKFDDWCQSSGLGDVKTAGKNARLDNPASFTCELKPGKETKASKAAMKTAVVGPGGKPYLTDGHHTMTSFMELPDGGPNTRVRVRVVANLSTKSPTAFWSTMQSKKWAWLTTTDGRAVTPSRLPQTLSVAGFADDDARSALYFTRDIGYTAGTVPFQEFYWGDWLRRTHPELLKRRDGSVDARHDQTRDIAKAMVDLKGSDKVAGGFTAKDLGVRKSVDKDILDDLDKPMTKADPGKLTYLVAYKQAHGIR